MTTARYGFVGLGNMGGPISRNMTKAGFELIVYDKAGPEQRSPAASIVASSLAELARGVETVFLSVPDGTASLAIAKDIIALNDSIIGTVIDFSTTGVEASRRVHQTFAASGIAYIDSPVSGGKSGARAATITLIWAGSEKLMEKHRPILEAISRNIFHVGDQPGQGQALKLLNNFLSSTALAATSEAMLFGLSQGLDLETMIDVVNVSTGRNSASSDKFPNRVLPGTFDSGFRASLMAKDVQLYYESVQQADTPREIGETMHAVWRQFKTAMPGSDQTEIYKFFRDAKYRQGNKR